MPYKDKAMERERNKRRYAENKETLLAYCREYNLRNADRLKAYRASRKEHRKALFKEWSAKNKEYRKEYGRKWRQKHYARPEVRMRRTAQRYGLSLAEYQRIYEEQGRKCAICGESGSLGGAQHSRGLPKGVLAVDHDHSTNAVRGLLCGACNTVVGHARDNIDILQSAINYLRPRMRKGGAA